MALLFTDSFDQYASADVLKKWSSQTPGDTGSSAPIIGAYGRRSTNGLRLTNSGSGDRSGYRLSVIPATAGLAAPSGATCIAGFAYTQVMGLPVTAVSTTENSTTASTLCAFRLGGTTHVWFRINTNGTISALRGTTLLGTSTAVIVEDTTDYWEFKVILSTTVGVVQLRKNGVLDATLDLSSQNTRGAASDTWDEFSLGKLAGPSSYSPNVDAYFDDLILLDGSGSKNNDFCGDVRIDPWFPNANGTNSDSTPSTGSDRYATIDEAAANGDTDYNTLAAVNDIDTLNFPACPVSGTTILGIAVNVWARKEDVGSAGLKAAVRIAGTDYLSAEKAVTSSYTNLQYIFELNPADSADFESTDLDTAEVGYQKSS